MKTGPLGAAGCALAACMLFLAGCAGFLNPHADVDQKHKSYTDTDSGVVLPVSVDSLARISLNTDASDTAPVGAHYSTAADQGSSTHLDADISIIPASSTTPDQLLGQTIRSVQAQPGFIQSDYHGLKAFGPVTVYSTQCTFARPASGERATFKIIIIPHGNYLVCFTFQLPAAREQEFQPIADGFIQTIIGKSAKDECMMPVTSGTF